MSSWIDHNWLPQPDTMSRQSRFGLLHGFKTLTKVSSPSMTRLEVFESVLRKQPPSFKLHTPYVKLRTTQLTKTVCAWVDNHWTGYCRADWSFWIPLLLGYRAVVPHLMRLLHLQRYCAVGHGTIPDETWTAQSAKLLWSRSVVPDLVRLLCLQRCCDLDQWYQNRWNCSVCNIAVI